MAHSKLITIGKWKFNMSTGELSNALENKYLEPKSQHLLSFFIKNHSQVLTKDQIIAAVWENTIVSDELLAKAISKLRKSLHDDPKHPSYIETLAKKGYRFIAYSPTADEGKLETISEKIKLSLKWWSIPFAVTCLIIALLSIKAFFKKAPNNLDGLTSELLSLKKQADDYYFQYTRIDNESAIRLYERIIAAQPNYGPAQSGLATALVQKALRWPNELGTTNPAHTSITQAHQQRHLSSPQAIQSLNRAQNLGERAVRLSPDDYSVQRALGLVYAAQEKFELALQQYNKAIELNPNAWGALINKSEILNSQGEKETALELLKQAYKAMEKNYAVDTVRIRPWLPKIAVSIAQKSHQMERLQDAEVWYRTVLNYSPLNLEANLGLMELLKTNGDISSALEICHKLKLSTSPELHCQL